MTGLLQKEYPGEPWPILVASLFLKITQRKQVEKVLDEFLERFPSPEDFLEADRGEVRNLIRPLGLWRRRTEELENVALRLVEDGEPDSKEEVREIDGVGEYMADSYAIFVLEDESVEPEDQSLREFLDNRAV